VTWGGPNLPSGLDQFDRKQEPAVEPVDDLSRFVMLRILEAETEPRVDGVPKAHHDPHGAVAHRYAGKVRADMVAFRRIVALYVDAVAAINDAEGGSEREAKEDQALGLQLAVAAVALRWSDHPDFRDDWRL
jgi:hypothetical protein